MAECTEWPWRPFDSVRSIQPTWAEQVVDSRNAVDALRWAASELTRPMDCGNMQPQLNVISGIRHILRTYPHQLKAELDERVDGGDIRNKLRYLFTDVAPDAISGMRDLANFVLRDPISRREIGPSDRPWAIYEEPIPAPPEQPRAGKQPNDYGGLSF